MTLSDLTREFFTYLVRFRQLAASPQPPALTQVQRDLEDILARMEDGARSHPPLARSYELMRYPLVALADELITDSEWKQAAQWRGDLLERRLYGTAEASQKVFDLAKDAKRWPQDAVGSLYLCLGLGFHGKYSPQDQELAALKAELLGLLPTSQGRPEPPAPPLPAEPRPAPSPEFSAALAQPSPPARRFGWGLAGLAAAAGLALAVWGLWPQKASLTPEAGAPVTPATIIARPAEERPAPAQPAAPPLETARASIAAILPTGSSQTKPEVAMDKAETAGKPKPPPPPAPAEAARPADQAKAPPPEAPAPAAAPAPAVKAEETPAQPQTHVIQAGLYVGPIQSNRLAESLTAAGFAAWVVERTRADGKLRYIVLVGPFAQKEMALRAIQGIQEKFEIRPFLTDPEDPGGALR